MKHPYGAVPLKFTDYLVSSKIQRNMSGSYLEKTLFVKPLHFGYFKTFL